MSHTPPHAQSAQRCVNDSGLDGEPSHLPIQGRRTYVPPPLRQRTEDQPSTTAADGQRSSDRTDDRGRNRAPRGELRASSRSRSRSPAPRGSNAFAADNTPANDADVVASASSVVDHQYAGISVTVAGSHCPAPLAGRLSDAQDLLDPIVIRNIERLGYGQLTPMQRYVVPIVSQGRDLMVNAHTGSGKTAAYMLPIISALHRNPPPASASSEGCARRALARPRALVLAPTRELASGIYWEACKLAQHGPLRVALAIGGVDTNQQLREIERGVDVLVATPIRLLTLIEKARVSVADVRHLVLEETDRMLDMEFGEHVRRIVKREGMPRAGDRQTLLFAADNRAEVQLLATDLLNADSILLYVGFTSSD